VSFIDTNPGVRDWLARSREYSFGALPGWTYYRARDGQTLGISDHGVVQILPDEQGTTAWFGDVMAEGRAGAERWTQS
jgi:hypothetical protein